MRRRRCAHCNTLGAPNRWMFHACADGRKKRTGWLCDPCDVRANAWLLSFFKVPGGTAKLEAYKS